MYLEPLSGSRWRERETGGCGRDDVREGEGRTNQCGECDAGLAFALRKTGPKEEGELDKGRPRLIWRCRACGRRVVVE